MGNPAASSGLRVIALIVGATEVVCARAEGEPILAGLCHRAVVRLGHAGTGWRPVPTADRRGPEHLCRAVALVARYGDAHAAGAGVPLVMIDRWHEGGRGMGGETCGRPLRVGLFLPIDEAALPDGPPRWADLAAMAIQAEALGFDSLWLPDHLLYRFPDAPPTGQWECWSVLAALAATTRRLVLGTLVAATSFRNPALLAKMADTVDEISSGRLVLGLGAGYHEPEYAAFGYPYDHRASRFEEALTIIHGLLRHGRIDFAGRFYTARDCELRPRGPRPTGLPLIVGTRGERMLRLTARLADGWNVWLAFGDGRAAAIPALRDAVDAACRAEGRDPATLARSVTVMVDPLGGQEVAFARVRPEIAPRPIAGPPAEIAAALRELAAEGVAEVQVYLPTCTPAAIEALGPVLAALERD